jgi:hypothetical protein
MGVVVDKKLYNSIKKSADKIFKKSSANKSSWIVRKYKKSGGKYRGEKTHGLKDWYNSQKSQKGHGSIENIKEAKEYLDKSIILKNKLNDISKGNLDFQKVLDLKQLVDENIIDIEKGHVYINKLIKHANNNEKIKMYKNKLLKLPMLQHGSGKPQYYGKKSSIMVKVPISVKNYINKETKILKENKFKGGRKTGEKRAKQLRSQSYISIEDVRYIRNWYARHIFTSFPSYLAWKKEGKPINDNYWKNKHGIYAISIWGGIPALKWINSEKIINLLNKHYNKNYKKIKIPN